jgi:hypothetical protein
MSRAEANITCIRSASYLDAGLDPDMFHDVDAHSVNVRAGYGYRCAQA